MFSDMILTTTLTGFSLNKDIVLNTYWAKSVLGKYQVTDDGAISILGKELDGLAFFGDFA